MAMRQIGALISVDPSDGDAHTALAKQAGKYNNRS